MTVLEAVRKYGLEDFEKTYNNQYGNYCNLLNLDELKQMEVKSVYIHLPTQTATITIIMD